MSLEQQQELESQYVMHTFARKPVELVSGKGMEVEDAEGNTYLDFIAGIGVCSLGHCHPVITKALQDQSQHLIHVSNYYYIEGRGELSRKISGLLNGGNPASPEPWQTFYANSGAEANECAIKLARKYSFDKYGKDAERNIIITLVNSFHGRTLCTLSATGQEVFHNYFFPFVGGFENVIANDIDDLMDKLNKLDNKVCAVMFEFVQGEGGVIPLQQSFVNTIMLECAKRDILTIADEVQTGVGRTGRLLTSEIYNVKPDITTLAKGLAGGVPIGVCLANKKCSEVLGKGTHGSTFGGNPISCAGGNAVLDKVTKPEFLEEVRKKGEYFRVKLAEIDEVEGVDGLGLMIGVRLKTKKAADVLNKCFENGLLILTAKDKLRFLPPLNISYEQIDKGLAILKKVLDEK